MVVDEDRQDQFVHLGRGHPDDDRVHAVLRAQAHHVAPGRADDLQLPVRGLRGPRLLVGGGRHGLQGARVRRPRAGQARQHAADHRGADDGPVLPAAGPALQAVRGGKRLPAGRAVPARAVLHAARGPVPAHRGVHERARRRRRRRRLRRHDARGGAHGGQQRGHPRGRVGVLQHRAGDQARAQAQGRARFRAPPVRCGQERGRRGVAGMLRPERGQPVEFLQRTLVRLGTRCTKPRMLMLVERVASAFSLFRQVTTTTTRNPGTRAGSCPRAPTSPSRPRAPTA